MWVACSGCTTRTSLENTCTLPDWRLSCQGCRLVLSSTRDTQIVADRVEVERGITPPVPTQVLSVTSDAATAVSSVASQLQSVASVVATAVPGADAIVPRNISLGTKQFCVGFSNRLECNNLPVNTSEILPQALTGPVAELVGDFHRLDGILSKLSPGSYMVETLLQEH
jgi:hypothetical protein